MPVVKPREAHPFPAVVPGPKRWIQCLEDGTFLYQKSLERNLKDLRQQGTTI